MNRRYNTGIASRIFDVFNVILMIFIIIIMIYPLLNEISVSLSKPSVIDAGAVTFFPRGFNTLAYRYLVSNKSLWLSYLMTIVYAAGKTLFTLLFTSCVAYSLSISDFVFKKPITVLFAITMFFGGGLIPTYLLIASLGMLDTIWVMMLPGCVSAFNVVVFRTFFQGLPNRLRESAYMDGANDIVILFCIILPLSKALLATFALFTIISVWNDWFSPVVYLKKEWRMPLQVILRRMLIQEEIISPYAPERIKNLISSYKMHPKNVQKAAVVVSLVPIYLFYPFIQKHFTKGILIGSIKG